MPRAVAALLILLPLLTAAEGMAQGLTSPPKTAVVASIEGMIDLGLAPFVERVFASAQAAKADVVVLEINTFGGRVDAAVAIRDRLLRSKVRSVAFVDKRAISAGALIALAAEKIVMATGATIGAAMPVQLGQPGEVAKPVEEKSVSYVRKEFRATADARKRPGLIAEAMVDADVEIPGLIEKGKLLTLTVEDALQHKVADFQADTLDQLLSKLGLEGAEIRRLEENWAEHTVRLLTQPFVASLLMTLAMLGILIELRTPGFGVPGAVGVLCLTAFLWGHWLVHLVGLEQVLLISGGLILIALEVFVLPGFGIAGVLGAVSLLAGLSTSLLGAGASVNAILIAISRVAISSVLALVAGLVLLRFFPALPGGRKLILATALPAGGSPDSRPALEIGADGVTLTPLRPAGIASFAGRRVDVVSQGEFIEAGQEIEVTRDEGNRVVVARRSGVTPKGTLA